MVALTPETRAEIIDAHCADLDRDALEKLADSIDCDACGEDTDWESVVIEQDMDGEWRLCELAGWPDKASYTNLVAWCWHQGDERRLIVVNFSDFSAQARIRPPWDDLAGRAWRLTDVFRGEVYDRTGEEIREPGLYVDLEAWGFHFLRFEEI